MVPLVRQTDGDAGQPERFIHCMPWMSALEGPGRGFAISHSWPTTLVTSLGQGLAALGCRMLEGQDGTAGSRL